MNKNFETIPSESMSILEQYSWPGNIRELQNLKERAVILSSATATLEETERRLILTALEASDW